MPSKEKCAAEWKQLGYKSVGDCVGYGKKKTKPLREQSVMAGGRERNVSKYYKK